MSEVTDFCEKHGACAEGAKWASQYKTLAEVWANCKRGDWMLWMLRKRGGVEKVTYVRIAVARAEHVLPSYEARRPGDNRPHKAIDAAKAWIADPTEENRKAAAAAYAADAAERAWQADKIREIAGEWK